MSLYSDLIGAGFVHGVDLDNHESNLYVKATAQAMAIVNEHAGLTELYGTFFVCQRTGENWIDIPFMYDPFWEKRA